MSDQGSPLAKPPRLGAPVPVTAREWETLGARVLADDKCLFRVWAPHCQEVSLRLVSPREEVIPMTRDAEGYAEVIAEGVMEGTRYMYLLTDEDGTEMERPDPASFAQPDGVHGASMVVSTEFDWRTDHWRGLPLHEYVISEVHVGIFTEEGTFEAMISRLDHFVSVGITAVELMPVAQFPGTRNWGYDGAYPYAVQWSYGGPLELKELVDECHARGLAVVLDVVYNHMGPEGSYFRDFGPYFTGHYITPWGEGINFDAAHSDHVRRYFLENALRWVREFRFDALRLDALHAIVDLSATPFLEELSTLIHAESERQGRSIYLIAESDLNDVRLLRSADCGGYGLDAQWSDDFHHSLHTLLTGETCGYYADYGKIAHMVKAIREGFVYSGQHSFVRQRAHGNSSREIPAHRFVVCAQNHDQIGNRMLGERLSTLVDFESLKLAAGMVLLSPNVPMLFMGEEWGDPSPFLYFVSHSDPDLISAVCDGRRSEFEGFHTAEDEVPDPQSEETFARSRVDWSLIEEGQHAALLELHRSLIRLRRSVSALANLSQNELEVHGSERRRMIWMRRWAGRSEVVALFNFSEEDQTAALELPAGRWLPLLDSADEQFGGPGALLTEPVEVREVARVGVRRRAFTLLVHESLGP